MSNEYLKLYRHTAAEPIAQDTAVDVNALLRIAAKEAALLAASGEVTVRFTPLDKGYSIAGDKKQPRRAMANLLSNACKLAPFGSEVEIWAKIAAHKVTINVFDAGPLIPDNEIALLFNGFFKDCPGGWRKNLRPGLAHRQSHHRPPSRRDWHGQS